MQKIIIDSIFFKLQQEPGMRDRIKGLAKITSIQWRTPDQQKKLTHLIVERYMKDEAKNHAVAKI